MANSSVILPCAVLGGIVAAALLFTWWWFPRTWKKGNKQDGEEIAMSVGNGLDNGLTREERLEIAGQHAREYIQAIKARNEARDEGRELNEPPPIYQPFARS